MTQRLAALGALIPVFVAYADAPFATFGQRFVAHRWAERMVLFSIELNWLLLWMLAKLTVSRDAGVAPESLRLACACAGLLLAWAAAALAVWAKLALGRSFTASFAVRPDHALITHGPYAVVRHPMYTAFVALLLRLAIAWDSWVSVGFALLYAAPSWLHTAIEEPTLESHFGDAWREYRARVPRMVRGWPHHRAAPLQRSDA